MVFSFQAGLACACARGLGRECLSCPVSRSLPTPFLPPLPGVGSGPPGKEKEERKKDGWGAVYLAELVIQCAVMTGGPLSPLVRNTGGP